MRRIHPVLSLLAVVAGLLLAGPARASDPALDVFHAYQSAGKVDPCKFTSAKLQAALNSVGPDSNQYSPDFRDAIKTALEQRAAGACNKKSTTGTTTGAAPAAATSSGSSGTPAAPTPSTPAPSTPAASTPAVSPVTSTPQPSPAVTAAPVVADDAIPAAATAPTTTGADNTPAPLLVLALMLGLLLVLGALWASVRWLGFDPPWLARWRHASQEAGWRASAAWSEFTDWVRLGR
jgi:cobalamin biosynthesis Mg chelatase CobN